MHFIDLRGDSLVLGDHSNLVLRILLLWKYPQVPATWSEGADVVYYHPIQTKRAEGKLSWNDFQTWHRCAAMDSKHKPESNTAHGWSLLRQRQDQGFHPMVLFFLLNNHDLSHVFKGVQSFSASKHSDFDGSEVPGGSLNFQILFRRVKPPPALTWLLLGPAIELGPNGGLWHLWHQALLRSQRSWWGPMKKWKP